MACPLGTWSFRARLEETMLTRARARVWCYKAGLHPLRYPPAALQLLEGTAAAVPVWNKQLQWFKQNCCNRSDSKGPLCP